MNNKQAFLKGLRDGVPIFLGYLSVSFTFGLRASEYGLPPWFAVLVSMTNLTSAGQFAGLDLLVVGAGYLEIAVTTLVINLRYALMSLSLGQKARQMGTAARLVLSFGVTDEVFALASQQKGVLTAAYLAGLIFTPYWGWALGTAVGAGASGLLPLSVRSALGIAIYGMFLAIIVPPARQFRPVAITVLLAAGLSCLLRLVVGLGWLRLSGGWQLILCAVAAAAFAASRFPLQVTGQEEEGT